jgi:spermidine synthase
MRGRDLVFFVSGAAALVEEVVWSRLLTRVCGSDAAGAGTVIGVFLVGLGLGALAFGGVARRARDPRRLFLALEATIAVWAAASPFILAAIPPAAGPTARLAIAAGFLLVPTLAMGATFPVMGRMCVTRAADAGPETSRFYGANTLGAAAGALAAPFLFLPALGLTGSLLAAAALDLAAGFGALVLIAPSAPRAEVTGAPAVSAAERSAPWRLLLAAPLLLGFASLVYEVALVRVLIALTGASVYAFAIVLAVYLAGIGLGSRQAAGRLAVEGRAGGVLFGAALLAPLLACGGLLVLRAKVGVAIGAPLANLMLHDASPAKLWLSHALLAAPALLLPALAFGAALPAAVALAVERDPGAPCEPLLARVYALNTLGATLGALLGTFVLLPLGVDRAVQIALACAVLAAAVVARGRAALFAGAAVAVALAQIVALGGARPSDVVVHEVGVQSSATVTQAREGERDVLALRVNGKVVASTAPVDLRLQRLLGHVPGVLHGEVRTALVIGLGTGMTAGALLDLPTLERLTVVEISPAVLRAAESFAPWNGGVLSDPRSAVVIGDGRHRLLIDEARYDLVTSDPIHPWTRGSSDLYALEHFERMAAHLAPRGIASQWLPLYQLSDADVRTVAATWTAAFPHTAAWLTAYDLALVAWNEPPPGLDGWAARPLPERVAAALAEAGVRSTAELAALQVADDAALRAFAAGAEPMREDRPVLEFRAPRSFLAGYSTGALRWAARPEFVEKLPPAGRARGREVRAALERFLARLPTGGLSEAARAYGEELLGLPPTDG